MRCGWSPPDFTVIISAMATGSTIAGQVLVPCHQQRCHHPRPCIRSKAKLRKCGNGPNLVILPAELMVSHCNTAVHAARLLALQCGASNPENNLQALGLKQQANRAFERGNHLEAEKLYSEDLVGANLESHSDAYAMLTAGNRASSNGGLHYIFANRSALRLAQGNYQGALEDAKEAEKIAPKWAQAYIRQADVLSAMGEVRPALAALSTALRLDPSLRRSKGFQAKTRHLESKLTPAGASM